jgi:hypothetical protein
MSVKDIVAGPPDEKDELESWDNLPIKFEPRCKVCKSEFRTVIDRLLVGGNSFVGIAEQFRNKDAHLTGSKDAVRKSIERHSKAHLSVKDAAVRQLLEEKARESGVLVETVRQQLISSEALLELAVAKGTEQLSNSDSKIKYQDAIKAAELLRDKKYEEISHQMELVMRQQNAINQAIQKVVPKEYYPELVRVAKAIFEGNVGLAEDVVVGDVAAPEIIEAEPLGELNVGE